MDCYTFDVFARRQSRIGGLLLQVAGHYQKGTYTVELNRSPLLPTVIVANKRTILSGCLTHVSSSVGQKTELNKKYMSNKQLLGICFYSAQFCPADEDPQVIMSWHYYCSFIVLKSS